MTGRAAALKTRFSATSCTALIIRVAECASEASGKFPQDAVATSALVSRAATAYIKGTLRIRR